MNSFLCKKIGVETNTYKYKTLDGLRGICAALVVFHHIFWRSGDKTDSYWSLEHLGKIEKNLVLLIDQLPVSLFFILSGFLFFLIASKSKNALTFFYGRFLRIYPPVIFSLIIIIFSSITVFGYKPNCINFIVSHIPTPFGFLESGSVCDVGMGPLNSGVLWTLVWEWKLYFLVPVLMVLISTSIKNTLGLLMLSLFVILSWLTGLVDEFTASCASLFIAGFISANFSHMEIKKGWLAPTFISGLVLFLTSLLITQKVYNPITSLSLIPVFISITNGYSILGILLSKKIQLMGVTSFSIYLNHGAFQFISKHFLFDYGYYLWEAASVILISTLSPFTYKYIESSFQKIKLRKKTNI
ncbi:acyltransferase family protein [Klebsiella pneumoniae]|uniref:acyltransferase family protein n=1 Tax=Klebsiella pneumoniae TaxID=573 RepID=UPI0040459E56